MAEGNEIFAGATMDIHSPEFAAALAGQPIAKVAAKAGSEEATVSEEKDDELEEKVSTDETEEQASSAAAEEDEDEKSEKDDKEEKSDDPKAAGLAKELKRVRAINKERDDALAALNKQVEELKAKVEATSKTPEEQAVVKLAEMTQSDYDRLNQDWNTELANATAAYALAKDKEDETALAKAQARIDKAQNAQALFTKAHKARADKQAKQSAEAEAEQLTIVAELTQVKAAYDTAFPDLADKSSQIWKAGKKQYDAHPKLMQKLGPVAEVVATAMAIIKNPKLVGRDPSAVRKELVNNIEETVNNVLNVGGKGAGGPKTAGSSKAVPQFTDVQAFNEYIEKLKNG